MAAYRQDDSLPSIDKVAGAIRPESLKTAPATVPAPAAKIPSSFPVADSIVNREKPVEPVDADSVVAYSQPVSGPGIFKGHALKVANPEPLPVERKVEDWITLTLIGLLTLLTWFNFLYHKIFRQLFSASFNPGLTGQIVRDESVLLQRATLVLSVISYALIGLFIHLLFLRRGLEIPLIQTGILRFALLSVLVATAYSLKMLVLRFLSEVFDIERPVALYTFNIFLMVMLSGLVLFPVNVVMAYAPERIADASAAAGIIILVLLFFYRLIRAAGIWTGIPRFSLFYLFLYLCSFEIAPLLILWKVTTLL